MKLVFSDDFVRHATISDEFGNVLYKVTTAPCKGFGTPRKSTVWKVAPGRAIYADGLTPLLRTNLEQELVHQGFKQLGEIEWHTFSPSKLRVVESDGGLGDLSGEGRNSKDFIPAKGGLCRKRVFKGSDGHNYHWELGLLKCTLYRDNGASNPIPIAKYHRRRNFWFPFVKSRDGGYLDINATVRGAADADAKRTDNISVVESHTVCDTASMTSTKDVDSLVPGEPSDWMVTCLICLCSHTFMWKS
ncbi:hypothetical protein EDC04DRAFT_2921755 [Pisolithus marmoratus]|nr:hypothetical protein EDC04DRAFT_2921755 [Pisolithus marmoratus]